MLAERSITLAPDTEQEDKAEQLQQDYTIEEALGYDSDYASTYDYPTTEDTNGTQSMEDVSIILPCSNPSFVRNWYSYTRFFSSRTQTTTTKTQWNTNHTMDTNKKL